MLCLLLRSLKSVRSGRMARYSPDGCCEPHAKRQPGSRKSDSHRPTEPCADLNDLTEDESQSMHVLWPLLPLRSGVHAARCSGAVGGSHISWMAHIVAGISLAR